MDEDRQVELLMQAYPSLDRMLCETLLKADKRFINELLSSNHDPTETKPVETVPIKISSPIEKQGRRTNDQE